MPCAGVPGSLRPKADFDHRDSMIVLSTTSNVSDTKEAEAIDTLASCPSSVLSVRRESQVLIRSRISELVFNLDELSGQELPRPIRVLGSTNPNQNCKATVTLTYHMPGHASASRMNGEKTEETSFM